MPSLVNRANSRRTTNTFVFEGGTDQRTPAIVMPPGKCLYSKNVYAKVKKGYKQNAGYEKYDSAAVPGGGPMRGVWYFDDKCIAARDDLAESPTACKLHESSGSGWTEIDLGAELDFTAGTDEFLVGETVTDGTATGVIGRVQVDSGSWATNDAAGTLYIFSVSGTFTATTITSTSGSATGSGAQTAVSLSPSGRYEFDDYNFGTLKVYGADGVNKAFQYDGTYFLQIHTGKSTDNPQHIKGHSKHLFLAFGPEVQFSSIADPFTYSLVTGADAVNTVEDITGFMELEGGQSTQGITGTLGIFSKNRTYRLYGSSAADFILDNFAEHGNEVGARRWSLQQMGSRTRYLDDVGIVDLRSVERYGDFTDSTISYDIDSFIQAQKNLVTCSMVIKSLSQYRLFFSDGRFLQGTFDTNKLVGWMFGLYPIPVTVCCAKETSAGEEILLFGSDGTDGGYIYKMESGNDFDGHDIDSVIHLVFTHSRSVDQNKRYRGATLHIKGTGSTEIVVSAEYGYADPSHRQIVPQAVDVEGFGSILGDVPLGSFTLGGRLSGAEYVRLDGVDDSVGLIIYSSGSDPAYELDAATLHYSPRRRKRG